MEAIAPLLTQYPIKRYDKGQQIIFQDMVPTCCYVIRSGFVKTYAITAGGDEKPVSFDGKDDLFPVAWAFGRAETAFYYHQAYTDCELYHIPREDFQRIVQSRPKLLYRFTNYLLDRCLDYQSHISSLEQAKACDKLMHALQFLTYRFGKKVARSKVRMLLPLTQQDLANFLGLTRETTGTQLKQLEQQGILRYHRQEYVIHQDKLDELLEER
jgi:CRP/FNR family cyclic AMP-dependent transcriptional regulator